MRGSGRDLVAARAAKKPSIRAGCGASGGGWRRCNMKGRKSRRGGRRAHDAREVGRLARPSGGHLGEAINRLVDGLGNGPVRTPKVRELKARGLAVLEGEGFDEEALKRFVVFDPEQQQANRCEKNHGARKERQRQSVLVVVGERFECARDVDERRLIAQDHEARVEIPCVARKLTEYSDRIP